jgi:hypothetical protein
MSHSTINISDLIYQHRQDFAHASEKALHQAVQGNVCTMVITPAVIQQLSFPTVFHSKFHQVAYSRLLQVLSRFFSYRQSSQYNFSTSPHHRRFPVALYDEQRNTFEWMFFSWPEKVVLLWLLLIEEENSYKLMDRPRLFRDTQEGIRLPPNLIGFIVVSKMRVTTGSPITTSSVGWGRKVMDRLFSLWSFVLDVYELVDRMEWNRKDEGREELMDVGAEETRWTQHRALAVFNGDVLISKVIMFIAFFYLFNQNRANGVRETSVIGYIRLLLMKPEVFQSRGQLKAFLQEHGVHNELLSTIWFESLERFKWKMSGDAPLLEIGQNTKLNIPRDIRPVMRYLVLRDPLERWLDQNDIMEIVPYAMSAKEKNDVVHILKQAEEFAILCSTALDDVRNGLYIISPGNPGARIVMSYWTTLIPMVTTFEAYDLHDGTTLIIRSKSEMFMTQMFSLAAYIFQQHQHPRCDHPQLCITSQTDWLMSILHLIPWERTPDDKTLYPLLLFLRTQFTGRIDPPDEADKIALLKHSWVVLTVMIRYHEFRRQVAIPELQMAHLLRKLLVVGVVPYLIEESHLQVVNHLESAIYHSGSQFLQYDFGPPSDIYKAISFPIPPWDDQKPHSQFGLRFDDPLMKLHELLLRWTQSEEVRSTAFAVALLHLSVYQPVVNDRYMSTWLPESPSIELNPVPTYRDVDTGPHRQTIEGACVPLFDSLMIAFNHQRHHKVIIETIVNANRSLPIGVQLTGWPHSIWQTLILPRPLPSNDLIHPMIASLAVTTHNHTVVPSVFNFERYQNEALARGYDSDTDWNLSGKKTTPTKRKAVDPPPPPPPPPPANNPPLRHDINSSFQSFQSTYSPQSPMYSPCSPDYQYSPSNAQYSPDRE